MKSSIEIYNKAYHTGIKCAPTEALKDDTGTVMVENEKEGKYSDRFVVRKREKFYKDQIVRVSKSKYLGCDSKYRKGRFVGIGKIMYVCLGDSYLVEMETGKIVKKRHYNLKGVDESFKR